MDAETELAGVPRWRGRRGRLEVHYLTATDERTGTGLWLHHELVAPLDGEPYGHGWIALFPTGTGPAYHRFGPSLVGTRDAGTWFAAADTTMSSTSAQGNAGPLAWELSWPAEGRPLWTFPRWVWRREALPAAQVLPVASTVIEGTVGGASFRGIGAVAHIYGHGNAHRWAWLHADLGDGDVLELVAAVARRPGMRALPPLPLVQLRVDGHDWPRDPLATAPLLRARIQPNAFTVRGVVGARRLRVEVELPPERCVEIGYTDPDRATATCTNSERADVTVITSRLTLTGWRQERRWRLDATGHAEIGSRP
jgi:hypothetical protein